MLRPMAGTPLMANLIMPVASRIAASIANAPTNGKDHPGRLSNQLPPSPGGGVGAAPPVDGSSSPGCSLKMSNVVVVIRTVVLGFLGVVVVVDI